MKKIKLFPVFILCSMFLISCTNESSVTSDPLYEIAPSISNCTAGSLSSIEKQKVLTYINSVRTTYNLPLVKNDSTRDRLAQEAALIGAANGVISDAIASSDECYSANAAQECRNGNRSLWGSTTSKWPSFEIHINDWMTGLRMVEQDSENINCRRRLLNPFLKSVTFGIVIGTPKKGEFKYISSATLLTKDYGDDNKNETVDLSGYKIEYIAYPYENCSAKLFDPDSFLSFSVLYDKSSKANNGSSSVNFSEATVEVSAGTQQLEIVENSLTYDYNNIGLPNNLQWKVEGLTKNASYTVKIRDVIVDGERKNYNYTFSFK
jgi:hypothetical protein